MEESEKSLFNTFEGSFVNREIGKGVAIPGQLGHTAHKSQVCVTFNDKNFLARASIHEGRAIVRRLICQLIGQCLEWPSGHSLAATLPGTQTLTSVSLQNVSPEKSLI